MLFYLNISLLAVVTNRLKKENYKDKTLARLLNS